MNFVALDGFPNFTFPARDLQTHKGALYLIPPRVTHFYPIPPKIGPKMAFFFTNGYFSKKLQLIKVSHGVMEQRSLWLLFKYWL